MEEKHSLDSLSSQNHFPFADFDENLSDIESNPSNQSSYSSLLIDGVDPLASISVCDFPNSGDDKTIKSTCKTNKKTNIYIYRKNYLC